MPPNLCVRTRAALTAANLTSPKVVDGVAPLNTKCDVTGLKMKATEVESLESDLEFCEIALGKLQSAKALNPDGVLVLLN